MHLTRGVLLALHGDDARRTAFQLAQFEARRRRDPEGLFLQRVKLLKRHEGREVRLVVRHDFELQLDGGADLDAGEVRDEQFTTRVALGVGHPAGVHHVDFPGGDLLPRTALGRDHGVEQVHFLIGRIITDFHL